MATEIDALISQINKKQKSEIMIRGADLLNQTWLRTSSGSLSMDLMLGGGWPLNCMCEIIGTESAGKTVMALKTVASNQLLDPDYHVLWVASEEFDPKWAATLGVDVSRMTFVMTNVMEDAYESCLQVMSERAADCVIIDSLPALVPSEEAEKSMMDFTVGRGALLTNKFMRKSYEALGRSLVEYDRPILCIAVNQWRDRIGVLYGDPRTTPGGRGKNYRFAIRVDVSRLEYLTDHGTKVGQTIKCQTLKNKTAPPRREGQVDFYFLDSGEFTAGEFDVAKEIFDLALVSDVIKQKGSWFYFHDEKWQGSKTAWEALHADPALQALLDTEVRTHLGVAVPTARKVGGTKRRRVE